MDDKLNIFKAMDALNIGNVIKQLEQLKISGVLEKIDELNKFGSTLMQVDIIKLSELIKKVEEVKLSHIVKQVEENNLVEVLQNTDKLFTNTDLNTTKFIDAGSGTNITIQNRNDSIPDQIRKLSELKDDGIISEVEFTEKKAILLAKI